MESFRKMVGWPRRRKLITFDLAARPDGGAEVISEFAAPLETGRKEPVGHAFQVKVLKKHGFYGGCERGPGSGGKRCGGVLRAPLHAAGLAGASSHCQQLTMALRPCSMGLL